MTTDEHRIFKARMDALSEATVFVEHFSSLHQVGRPDLLRLTLLVEELFTNTVVHGYGRECDAPIYISLGVDGDAVGLLYEDAAPQYDPLSQLSAPAANLTASVDSRPIGKLGVHLIRQLTEEARYTHENGRNRLWLRLRLES
jgi:serine/threonine-protein kinase RsbW